MSRTFSSEVLAASKDVALQTGSARSGRTATGTSSGANATACAFPDRGDEDIRPLRCISARLGGEALGQGRRRDPAQPHLAGDIDPAILFPLPTRRLDIPDLAPDRVVTHRTIRRHGAAHLAAVARKKFLDDCHASWCRRRLCRPGGPNLIEKFREFSLGRHALSG